MTEGGGVVSISFQAWPNKEELAILVEESKWVASGMRTWQASDSEDDEFEHNQFGTQSWCFGFGRAFGLVNPVMIDVQGSIVERSPRRDWSSSHLCKDWGPEAISHEEKEKCSAISISHRLVHEFSRSSKEDWSTSL
ncbi:hypothetical protein MUK42_11522 [Musa troglodytarum]|uniref:Uncharacterized protein n=1 Tax=Musa troglodytarum TaxID=320322 RepID=A0A9E7H6P8_9LILI|nr:hypothetical protein MUK42_11522 [Musa troglodytarum]